MSSQYPHEVQHVAAGVVTDAWGQKRLSWAEDDVTVSGSSLANIQPVSTDEAVVTAETLIDRWRIFEPADSTLTAEHRVRWNDDDYEVDGTVVRRYAGSRVRRVQAVLKLVKDPVRP